MNADFAERHEKKVFGLAVATKTIKWETGLQLLGAPVVHWPVL